MEYVMSVVPANINITSYALAKLSESFYTVSKTYEVEEFFVFKFLLYCISIELGLKSAILSRDNSVEKKKELANKNLVGHNLLKVISIFEQMFNGQDIIGLEDKKSVAKINKYYEKKGLEYFTSDVIFSAGNGFQDFPELSAIENTSKKIVDFLVSNNYWR